MCPAYIAWREHCIPSQHVQISSWPCTMFHSSEQIVASLSFVSLMLQKMSLISVFPKCNNIVVHKWFERGK